MLVPSVSNIEPVHDEEDAEEEDDDDESDEPAAEEYFSAEEEDEEEQEAKPLVVSTNAQPPSVTKQPVPLSAGGSGGAGSSVNIGSN